MRKNRLFTALAAATLLVSAGAGIAETTNQATVQAATKTTKKATTTKRYSAVFKRKPAALYNLVISKDKKTTSVKKINSKKLIKTLGFKKGSKSTVLNGIITKPNTTKPQYYWMGNIKYGKKNYRLCVKSSDVTVKSKKIKNLATTSAIKTNVQIPIKTPTMQEYLDTQVKSYTGTVKQDTSNLFTPKADENNKTTFEQYNDASGNKVTWTKGKQFKVYAKMNLDLSSKDNPSQTASVPFYVTTNIENNTLKYIFIPAELVDLQSGAQASDIPEFTAFASTLKDNFTKWGTDNITKQRDDYLTQLKAKQEQAKKDAAAKKAKTKQTKKKSTKKTKKATKKTTKAKKTTKK